MQVVFEIYSERWLKKAAPTLPHLCWVSPVSYSMSYKSDCCVSVQRTQIIKCFKSLSALGKG